MFFQLEWNHIHTVLEDGSCQGMLPNEINLRQWDSRHQQQLQGAKTALNKRSWQASEPFRLPQVDTLQLHVFLKPAPASCVDIHIEMLIQRTLCLALAKRRGGIRSREVEGRQPGAEEVWFIWWAKQCQKLMFPVISRLRWQVTWAVIRLLGEGGLLQMEGAWTAMQNEKAEVNPHFP